jgi:hypothetical protein
MKKSELFPLNIGVEVLKSESSFPFAEMPIFITILMSQVMSSSSSAPFFNCVIPVDVVREAGCVDWSNTLCSAWSCATDGGLLVSTLELEACHC